MNHSDDSPVPNQPAFPAVKKGLQGSPSQIDIKSGGHNIKSRYIKNIYSAVLFLTKNVIKLHCDFAPWEIIG